MEGPAAKVQAEVSAAYEEAERALEMMRPRGRNRGTARVVSTVVLGVRIYLGVSSIQLNTRVLFRFSRPCNFHQGGAAEPREYAYDPDRGSGTLAWQRGPSSRYRGVRSAHAADEEERPGKGRGLKEGECGYAAANDIR